MVTLRGAPDELRCTVNLRAPLLIDTALRVGWQYVLANDAYDIRHAIHQWNGSGRWTGAPDRYANGRR